MRTQACIGNKISKKKMFIIGVHFDGNQIVYCACTHFRRSPNKTEELREIKREGNRRRYREVLHYNML